MLPPPMESLGLNNCGKLTPRRLLAATHGSIDPMSCWQPPTLRGICVKASMEYFINPILRFYYIGGRMDILEFIDKLDNIRLKYNKQVIEADKITSIMEDITNELSQVCSIYERRIRRDEIDLVFTCFNNENCVHIYIETKPLNLEKDIVFLTWHFSGSNCDREFTI